MKNKHFLVVALALVISSVSAAVNPNIEIQEVNTITVKGTFDGYDEEDGFAFLIENKEDETEDYTFFEAALPEALKTADLKSDKLIGKKFEITYQVSEYEVEDEYGNTETYEKFTIVKLKQL